jgi:hypothetical protein
MSIYENFNNGIQKLNDKQRCFVSEFSTQNSCTMDSDFVHILSHNIIIFVYIFVRGTW